MDGGGKSRLMVLLVGGGGLREREGADFGV